MTVVLQLLALDTNMLDMCFFWSLFSVLFSLPLRVNAVERNALIRRFGWMNIWNPM